MKGYSVTFAFFCSPSISSVSYPIPQITHGPQLYILKYYSSRLKYKRMFIY